MLTMRDHGVEDYETLDDMDATNVGTLAADDRACLEDVGQYLAATDAWQRFGVWLLHKHFEPRPGEVFVERVDRTLRRTATTPRPKSAHPQVSATAVRFDDEVGDGVRIVGMEFADTTDFGETAPLSQDDADVLSGIAERLAAHDKTHRFGLRLIRNPLDMSESELLHETCDRAARTLHCTVDEHDAMFASHQVIQTGWRWRVVEGSGQPVVMQDCTAGCVRVGSGHDIGHAASGTDDHDDPIQGEPDLPF